MSWEMTGKEVEDRDSRGREVTARDAVKVLVPKLVFGPKGIACRRRLMMSLSKSEWNSDGWRGRMNE